MQTPTHTLLALVLLGKRGAPSRNWTVVAGSLAPDMFIYIAWPIYTFGRGESQTRFWDETYFQAPGIQLAGAVSNSFPLFGLLAVVGWVARSRRWARLLWLFALAALIHLATDIPVHAEDAHRHFWPLSDWRFHSPLSYWNEAYHARWIRLGEAVLGLGLCALLLRRFRKASTQITLGLLAILYTLMLTYSLFAWL